MNRIRLLHRVIAYLQTYYLLSDAKQHQVHQDISELEGLLRGEIDEYTDDLADIESDKQELEGIIAWLDQYTQTQ